MRQLHPQWLLWPQTQRLIQAFADQNAPLRFVGGCVRDTLSGRETQDVDAATPLVPQATLALLEKAGIRGIPTGIDHGTVTAVMDGKHFEITTLRKDVACDGRHAEVEYTDDWREDAARRDFTFNALYLSPEGEIFDYFAGETDLQAGQVRFIGNAQMRIREDYLRILRFFRFFARYGKTPPDSEALDACREAATHLTAISGERVQGEMLKLLTSDAYDTLQLMEDCQVLAPCLGLEITDCEMFRRWRDIVAVTGVCIPPIVQLVGFVLKAGHSPEQALESLSARLKLSGHDTKTLRLLTQYHNLLCPSLPENEQKHSIRVWGSEMFRWAVLVHWAYQNDAITPASPYCAMMALAQQWQPPIFPLGGDDLIALGVAPGKTLGQMLQQLETLWEQSDYQLDKQQLLARLDNPAIKS